MARKRKAPAKKKRVENITHDEASRKNIPTGELSAVMGEEAHRAVQVAYERRSPDLDPQLVWRGKYEQDGGDLLVLAPPLYVQEKVQPKALIDELQRASRQRKEQDSGDTPDLFADFNGIPEGADKTEFYKHEQNWQNRMILGDSLQVMASLAEREGLRGKVQCIYIDPPYGIGFSSNFQWSTTTQKVTDGKVEHISREPEQVRAFRDTWRDGVHSYLAYLRDRLVAAHALLAASGSIFVQISAQNVHRVRAILDEVFGSDNFVAEVRFRRGGFQPSRLLPETSNFVLWYCCNKDHFGGKFRRLHKLTERSRAFPGQDLYGEYKDGTYSKVDRDNIPQDAERVFRHRAAYSASVQSRTRFPFFFQGREYLPSGSRGWSTTEKGMVRAARSNRLMAVGNTLERKMYWEDAPFGVITTDWSDTISSGFGDKKLYVVQTQDLVVQRCILMATDPGDLVLDPTCGSGTTAYVAEQWGRRWITIDTSRVALTLARSRIMGARYSWYLLADSPEGQEKEAEVSRTVPPELPTRGDIRLGFVYRRVPQVSFKSIARNAEIDVIYEKHQRVLDPLRERLNVLLDSDLEEWDVPPPPPPPSADGQEVADPTDNWHEAAKKVHAEWWQARIARQQEIDATIAANAGIEYLYDQPFVDDNTARVAGPFTVESLSPHRVLPVDDACGAVDASPDTGRASRQDHADFAQVILENLRSAGVQQARREDRIAFTSVEGWPGKLVCAEGRFVEGKKEKVAGIFIGPEFGTVSRPDLVAAAREAAEAGFDVLVACGFNFDAHSTDFDKLGRIPVLKARMNADLHMASELKNTGKGNLFVVFGEPDIEVTPAADGKIQVKVVGVDVYRPQTGEVVASETDDIALWMIDTDYDEESFFVRHAYFLGANDPYKALKTTLKAEIDEEAWASLHSDTSRPFARPESGRIAVKVINHLGDEVMKVIQV